MKNEVQVQNLVLYSPTFHLKKVVSYFKSTSFSHIFRELNVLADVLSKETLLGIPNRIIEEEFREGHKTSSTDSVFSEF